MAEKRRLPYYDFAPPAPEGHDALAEDLAMWLRVYYKFETWCNMEIMGCRPDVYAINRTMKTRLLVGRVYEVKVSRADFTRGLREAQHERYLRFCDQLYYVCPKDMIGPGELPKGVGLLERGEYGWYNRRAARKIGGGVSFECLMRLAMGKHTLDREQIIDGGKS